MPPNSLSTTGVLFEDDVVDKVDVGNHCVAAPRVWEIVWRNVVGFAFLHLSALYGLYLLLTGAVMWQTFVAMLIGDIATGLSVTTGAHRLWAHKSFKVKTIAKIMMVIFNCMAFQDAVIHWARDHRMHHKFSETDADPHNATRGFFFAHMGWLMVKKHPDMKAKGHAVDMSDLYAEPILVFQEKYYLILMPIFCFVLPTVIPMYFWGESFVNSFFVTTMLRYIGSLHTTWLVNSAAHLYGKKPYDQNINPADNSLVNLLTLGDGVHNFHHIFPWDYRAANSVEYFNMTTAFIDFMVSIGWAYDMKTASVDTIEKRMKRTGDGSNRFLGRGEKHQPKAGNEELKRDD